MISFPWKTSPLIINFNDDLTQEDIDEIKANFDVRRKDLPLMFLATRFDKFSSVWTQDKPTLSILRRLIFIAEKCYCFLQKQLKFVKEYDFLVGITRNTLYNYHLTLFLFNQPLFHPNHEVFDVVIALNKEYVSNFYLNLNFTKHKTTDDDSKASKFYSVENFPIVGYNPVDLFLTELNKAFQEYAIFFYDRFGGTKVFLLWKPNVFDPKPLLFKDSKYFKSTNTVSKSGVSNIVLDMDAVFADIKRIGEGLVQSVTPNVEKIQKLSE